MKREPQAQQLIPTQNTPAPAFYRVGMEALFDKDWNAIPIKEHKSWKYIQVGHEKVGIKQFEDKQGYSEPITFGYIFEGLFQKGSNSSYDKLTLNK